MDAWQPLLELIKSFGIGGIFMYLWFSERAERKEIAKQVFAIAVDAVKAEVEMTNALNALAGKLGK